MVMLCGTCDGSFIGSKRPSCLIILSSFCFCLLVADMLMEIDADTLDLAFIGRKLFAGFGVWKAYSSGPAEELGIVELYFRVFSVCLNCTCLCASALHLPT